MLQDGSVQPLSPALRTKATQSINHMAAKALRCLAFAQKTDLGMLDTVAQTMQTVALADLAVVVANGVCTCNPSSLLHRKFPYGTRAVSRWTCGHVDVGIVKHPVGCRGPS